MVHIAGIAAGIYPAVCITRSERIENDCCYNRPLPVGLCEWQGRVDGICRRYMLHCHAMEEAIYKNCSLVCSAFINVAGTVIIIQTGFLFRQGTHL